MYNPANLKFGAIARNKYGNAVFSPIYITYEVQKSVAEPSFVEMSVTRNSFIQKALQYQQGTVYERMAVNTEDFASLDVLLPAKDEQNKVGKYFSLLDSLITQYERKISHEKKLKEYLLQNMFPREGENVPRIRFPKFTAPWEQRKLGDYLKTSTEKNVDGFFTHNDVLSVSGDFGIVNQIEFKGRSFAGASVLNYGIVREKDVVYTKSPLKENPYGIIKTNCRKAGIVSTLYAIYHPTENTNSKFVECYFDKRERLNHYLHPLVNKGAKNDMKVRNADVLKGDVIFPSSIKEQGKIADIITKLEELITLHQRKLESLKELKKGLLQKMLV